MKQRITQKLVSIALRIAIFLIPRRLMCTPFFLSAWGRHGRRISWRQAGWARKGHEKVAAKVWLLDQYTNLFFLNEKKISGRSRIIAIAGVARCGKTEVAARMGISQGLPIINLDSARPLLNIKREADGGYYLSGRQHDLIWHLVDELVNCKITTCIIEGDLLIGYSSAVEADDPSKKYDIQELSNRQKKGSLHAFVIGTSREYIENKKKGILRHREKSSCWTKRLLSDQDVGRLAERIVIRSQELEQLAALHGITYIDISSSDFEKDVECAVTIINRECFESV